MKEITLNIDGKEIKVILSEKEIKKLVKKERKEWPQNTDEYWWIDVFGDVVSTRFCAPSLRDQVKILLGNTYRTEQEAINALRAQKLIAAITKRRKELNGNWKLNWEDPKTKWAILHLDGNLNPDVVLIHNRVSPFGIYKNFRSAYTIIKEFRDELCWYFYEYIVEMN